MDSNEYGRTFNAARAEQGFNSQADLDAFYAYHDHIDSCGDCDKPGSGIMLSDGFQPTQHLCPRALELQREWDSHSRFRMVMSGHITPI